MKTILFLSVATLGASACGSDSSGSQSRAVLTVTFGDDAAVQLDSSPTSDSTETALLIRVAKADVTTLISLHKPIVAGVIDVATDSRTLVWAKTGSETPRISVAGQLAVTIEGNVLNLEVRDLAKPEDAFGGSLLMSGTVDGVPQ